MGMEEGGDRRDRDGKVRMWELLLLNGHWPCLAGQLFLPGTLKGQMGTAKCVCVKGRQRGRAKKVKRRLRPGQATDPDWVACHCQEGQQATTGQAA